MNSADAVEVASELVRGRLVVLAGGTSAAGRAVAGALLDSGARVVIVGHDTDRLARVADEVAGVVVEECDLTDEAAVGALVERLHASHGLVDGILHLVGGWRGGGGLAGQSEEDFRFLERSFTALRHVTRALNDDLLASPAGRLAIVSSTAVAHPSAGGANYAAVKAASETWTRAVGQGFTRAGHDAPNGQTAAAVTFRVKSLDGLEDALGVALVALWDDEAPVWNSVIVELEEGA